LDAHALAPYALIELY